MATPFNEQDVRRFYQFFQHSQPTEIRVFDPPYHKGKCFWVTNEEDFVTTCRRLNRDVNVYIGTRDRRDRQTKDVNVASSSVIFIEIDEHDHKKPKMLPKLLTYLKGQGIQYGMIGFSGGGFHVYIPHQLVEFVTDEIRSSYASMLRSVRTVLRDAELDIDPKVFNLERVTRVLGTFNHKRGELSRIMELEAVEKSARAHNGRIIYDLTSQHISEDGARHTNEEARQRALSILQEYRIHKSDPWIFDLLNKEVTIKESTGGNSVVLKTAAILCVANVLSTKETHIVGQALAAQCEQRAPAAFHAWVQRVRDGHLIEVNRFEINKWLEESKYPLSPYRIEDDHLRLLAKNELTKREVDRFLKATLHERDALLLDSYFATLKRKSSFSAEAIRKRRSQLLLTLQPAANADHAINIPAEIVEVLSDPDLFDTITRTELDKCIVKELAARRTLFLCAQGRLVQNSQPASYNILVNSESGAGKDYVADNTLNLLPKDCYVKRTRISPTVFTYWHNPRYEPEWTWDGKVCYLEDISSSVFNHEVFKVMTSSGSHATVTIEQRAVDIEIRGKPVMITTSASAHPKPEMLRRFAILPLDETQDQTKAILERHAHFANVGITPEMDTRYVDAQRYLNRVRVRVPFAGKIWKGFPSSHMISRTHFPRFVDYIKASAAFHQYQRSRDEDGYVIAEPIDYTLAREAFHATTTNAALIPLTKDQRRLLNVIKEKYGSIFVRIEEIESHVAFITQRWLRDVLDKLTDYGFLAKDRQSFVVGKDDKGNDKTKKYICYSYQGLESIKLPEWNDLESGVEIKVPEPITPSKTESDTGGEDQFLNQLNTLNGLNAYTKPTTTPEMGSESSRNRSISSTSSKSSISSNSSIIRNKAVEELDLNNSESQIVSLDDSDLRDQAQTVLRVLRELENKSKGVAVPTKDITDCFDENNAVSVIETLERLAKESVIHEPRPGVWRVV